MNAIRRVYTTAEAAGELGVSRDTLLRWFREGRISPVPRNGRGWRCFSVEDISRIAVEAGVVRRPLVTGSGEGGELALFPRESALPLQQNPVRLIQYLGSKYRLLSQLHPHLMRYTPEGGAFLDIFAGTTCVAQTMLDHAKVIVNDSMIYSKVMGDVLINGHATDDVPLPSSTVLEESEAYQENYSKLTDVYEHLIRDEREILETDNPQALYEYCKGLPTFWRARKPASAGIANFLESARPEKKRGDARYEPACLFTTYYAGTYFGLEQAIEIDCLRTAISTLEEQGVLSPWQAKAFLCCLMYSLSAAVSTAGKHFAQPILTFNSERSKSFAKRRCMEDRRVSILKKIAECRDLLAQRTFALRSGNRSLRLTVEEMGRKFMEGNRWDLFKRDYLQAERVDCVYADPPYTAQQYSRFYHILETLCLYDYPAIQRSRDGTGYTTGLYRDERHYSAFCRTSKAPGAFAVLFGLCNALKAVCLLSYSESRAATGNRRMVTPQQLEQISQHCGMRMRRIELDHSYKPLNRAARAVSESDEIEVLYVFERNR